MMTEEDVALQQLQTCREMDIMGKVAKLMRDKDLAEKLEIINEKLESILSVMFLFEDIPFLYDKMQETVIKLVNERIRISKEINKDLKGSSC